jgi:putative Mg2+ transporter-C (MgtC) family protein
MTGIGFLGAGVIMKEGASIRGLTTAASIWITAAIGILAGVGFYSALTVVTVLTLSTLNLYRLVERQLPMPLCAQNFIRFHRDRAMTEAEIRALMKEHGFKISNMCFAVTHDRQFFEYDLVINTRDEENLVRLCRSLEQNGAVLEFKLCPTSD